MKKAYLLLAAAIAFSVLPASLANPINVYTEPDPRQDDWILEGPMEELGNFFPPDEDIASFEAPWEGYIPCPEDYQGGGAVQVQMINLTGTAWTEVYYVADPETSLSNMDEWVGDVTAPGPPMVGSQLAFKIDFVGVNTPLVYESMTPDGIFELGETWEFVIQDYFNTLGLPPEMFDSPGIAAASTGGPPSSGSIIAIPEPSAVILLIVGGAGLYARKRLLPY